MRKTKWNWLWVCLIIVLLIHIAVLPRIVQYALSMDKNQVRVYMEDVT